MFLDIQQHGEDIDCEETLPSDTCYAADTIIDCHDLIYIFLFVISNKQWTARVTHRNNIGRNCVEIIYRDNVLEIRREVLRRILGVILLVAEFCRSFLSV